MNSFHFYKFEGAGNDFVIIDARQTGFDLDRQQIATICDRRRGIGADGLMTLENDPAGAEFRMRYWNSDGGESTMCGNGGRCLAFFAHTLGLGSDHKQFSGSDGPHHARIISHSGNQAVVELGMIDVDQIISNDDGTFFANTGSPHAVIYTDNVDAVDVDNLGRQTRHSDRYRSTNGANVNFVELIDRDKALLKVRTFERGVEAETLACGTGAVAAAIVSTETFKLDSHTVTIVAPGGELTVSFTKTADNRYRNITLTGPAKKVFEGSYFLF